MRFAMIIDDYLPESTRVGSKMMHELACEYKKLGIDVVVITPGFNQPSNFEEIFIDDITIWKFKSGPIKDIGYIKRAVNETLLSYNAVKAIKPIISDYKIDGIICYSPSIFFSKLVSFLKSINNCKSFLVLRDIFPQWAVDSGLINQGSLIDKYFSFFERLNYRHSDYIGLMSKNGLEYFNRKTDSRYNTLLLPNWVTYRPYDNNLNEHSYRKKLNLVDKVIYFYGGNIGHAQDMKNLMKLVDRMQIYPEAHFLFVGQGDEVSLIINYAKNYSLSNFTYLKSVNQIEFSKLISEVDVGLFSLSKKHKSHNFPGKLLGYMNESLPILGSVNLGNDLLDTVNNYNAGDVFINGEDDLLFHASVSYLNKTVRYNKGKNATLLLQDMFSVETAAKKIFDSFAIR